MSVKPIKASVGGGGEFELVPAGVYLARCYRMIDLGTQTNISAKYGTKTVREVMLYWELLQDDAGEPVFMEDGERVFSISKKYTLSMNKKANLRKDLDSWRGKPFTDAEADDFDITKLLDKFCMIQVVHNTSGDKTYANVGTIMTTKKTAEGKNEVGAFSIDDPDMEFFGTLPQWLQDKIKESAEWEDDGEEQPATETEIEDTDIKVEVPEVKDNKKALEDVPF